MFKGGSWNMKNDKLKVMSLLVSLLMFVFSSIACAQVTLTIWEWDMNERPEAVQAIVKAFEEENPDIKIKIETTDWNALEQKIILAGEAGAMPDCVEISTPWMQTMAKRGFLEDLAPFIEKEKREFIKDYVLATKDPWTNTYNYLPWRPNVDGLYMVEEYLKEAGFTEPPKTWNEFEEIVRKCTVDTNGDGEIDQYGYVDAAVEPRLIRLTLFGFGGEFAYPDGKAALMHPDSLRAIEWSMNIFKSYGPPGIAMFQLKESRDIFMAGKATIIGEGSWMNTILETGMLPGLTWKPFLTPIDKNYQKRIATASAEMYGMGKGTKYPKEAWKFIKFITGPKADAILVKLSKGIPGHLSNSNMPEVQGDPLVKIFADQIAMAERIEFFEAYKIYPAYEKYQAEAYQKILYGKATVEEAIKELVERINRETFGD